MRISLRMLVKRSFQLAEQWKLGRRVKCAAQYCLVIILFFLWSYDWHHLKGQTIKWYEMLDSSRGKPLSPTPWVRYWNYFWNLGKARQGTLGKRETDRRRCETCEPLFPDEGERAENTWRRWKEVGIFWELIRACNAIGWLTKRDPIRTWRNVDAGVQRKPWAQKHNRACFCFERCADAFLSHRERAKNSRRSTPSLSNKQKTSALCGRCPWFLLRSRRCDIRKNQMIRGEAKEEVTAWKRRETLLVSFTFIPLFICKADVVGCLCKSGCCGSTCAFRNRQRSSFFFPSSVGWTHTSALSDVTCACWQAGS